MIITCVVDDHAGSKLDFLAEHGFSVLIENKNENILFDTGKTSLVLKHNLNNIRPSTVDKVIISHGHYDHTGGLAALRGYNPELFLHPIARKPKYAIENNKSRYIGMDEEYTNFSVNLISETRKIGSDMWILTGVERVTDFEFIPSTLFMKEDGNLFKDTFSDELSLVIKNKKGLIVISGCSHRGIVNILLSVREHFQDEIYAVIGGAHLMTASTKQIHRTLEEFKKIEPNIIALGHCTGINALCKFRETFKETFTPMESGLKII